MLNIKEDILKSAGNQTVDGSHWLHSIAFPVETNNCLFLQNIFFCVQHKKETHTGLEWREGE